MSAMIDAPIKKESNGSNSIEIKLKKKKNNNNNNNPINECLIKEGITIEFLFIYYYK